MLDNEQKEPPQKVLLTHSNLWENEFSNVIFPPKDLKRIQNFITMILFANERGGGCEIFLTRVCSLFIQDEPDFT